MPARARRRRPHGALSLLTASLSLLAVPGLTASPAQAAGAQAAGAASGATSGAAAGEINIVASHSGRCVEAEDSAVPAGTAILQVDCAGQPGAVWRLEESAAGGGTVNVVNVNSGRCLEMQGTAVGAAAKLGACSSLPNVSFTLVDRGATHVWLQPLSGAGSKCLEVTAGGHVTGTPLQLGECAGQSGIGFHQRMPKTGNDPARDPQGGVERVNVTSAGAQTPGYLSPYEHHPGSISANGRYTVFGTTAALAPDDTNNVRDVYLRDRVNQSVVRVSVASSGAQGNGHTQQPTVSADGRYVVFQSGSSNFAAGDGGDSEDVFVRDRHSGITELMSRSATNDIGNGTSHSPSMSTDGRYVVFLSSASNLVPGDANNARDLFVRDRMAGTIERIVVNDTGATPYPLVPDPPAISVDGRYVVFESAATGLTPGDTDTHADVYVRDRQTGTTRRISRSAAGAEGNGHSFPASITPDGRFVLFHSTASNLVPGDTNNVEDVFVHDQQTGATERIGVGPSGAQALMGSFHGSISADGRYVSFSSHADNLVPYDNNSVADVFVRDRQTGATVRASINNSGVQGIGASLRSRISGDGQYVLFMSHATNLVTDDTNNARDLFVRPRPKA